MPETLPNEYRKLANFLIRSSNGHICIRNCRKCNCDIVAARILEFLSTKNLLPIVMPDRRIIVDLRGEFKFVTTLIPNCSKLFNLTYFHNDLSVTDACDLLHTQPNGSFLIRKTEINNINNLNISFKIRDRIGHVRDFCFDSDLLNFPLKLSSHEIQWASKLPTAVKDRRKILEARIDHLRSNFVIDHPPVPIHLHRYFGLHLPIMRKDPFSLLTLCKAKVCDMTNYESIHLLEIPKILILEMKKELVMSQLQKLNKKMEDDLDQDFLEDLPELV